MTITVGIITVSDSCSAEPTKDTSGSTLAKLVKELFPTSIIERHVIPDDKITIEKTFTTLCDENKLNLILTTGGTGFSKRDVTPEATRAVIHRDAPAISTAITIDSLKATPMAMLSRGVAGIRNETLIINFPGSTKAVVECFNTVKPVLSHALALITDDLNEVKSTHSVLQSTMCPHGLAKSIIDTSKVAFRPRESPYQMIEMPEAFRLIDEIMKQWVITTESVKIEDALGRVIAEDVFAREPLPPFPASIKDGYACVSVDGACVRRVRGAIAAGEGEGEELKSGECARVNTGAAVPTGADCVVQVEDTILISASDDGKTEFAVEIMVAPKPDQDIRAIGADIQKGATLAQKGAVLDAASIGVLAGAGVQEVLVNARPKVALLSTGNELQNPTELKLKPAHIRDSNRMMLRTLLREHGFDTIDCGIARDEPDELVSAISTAFNRADILVCTGGVSMGDKDLLKPVLMNDFGASLHFGRVRMKPGKPSTFATCQFDGKTKYIFALPGNPVSAYVCGLLFVMRALRLSVGMRAPWTCMLVTLAHDVLLDPRPEYARATLHRGEGDLPRATIIGSQASSRLLSACGASVLLELPGVDSVLSLRAGTTVKALVTGRLDY